MRWRDLGVTHLTIDTRNAGRAGWSASTTGADLLECVAEATRRTAVFGPKPGGDDGRP